MAEIDRLHHERIPARRVVPHGRTSEIAHLAGIESAYDVEKHRRRETADRSTARLGDEFARFAAAVFGLVATAVALARVVETFDAPRVRDCGAAERRAPDVAFRVSFAAVLGVYAHDGRALAERRIERGLQRRLEIAGVCAGVLVVERDAAIVENRYVLRRQARYARGDEGANAGDRLTREPRAGAQAHAHAGARLARGLVGELGGLSRRDDDARVVDALDSAQARFDVARQPGTRLRVDHRLRREDADAGECLAGRLHVRVRHARKREAQQQIVSASRIDHDVIGQRRECDVPTRESLFDLTELLGM